MAQKELAQPLTRTLLILSGVLARADQIAQSFVCWRGNPDRGEITGPVTAGQFLRIAPVRLYPVTGFGGYQRGRHHFTGHPNAVSC